MLISPICENSASTFKAVAPSTVRNAFLKRETSFALDSFLHAYDDIMSKLSCKTEEGIEYISKNFPNVTIGDSLIFHNCGKNNHSILVRRGESDKSQNLTRIVVRQGNSTYSEKIVKDSFTLWGKDRVVKNPDNFRKLFPETIEFESQETIDSSKYEDRLQGVLDDLDSRMLEFRKFLLKNSSMHTKVPDGALNHMTAYNLREFEKVLASVNKKSEQIPHTTLFKFKKTFPSYFLTPGGVGAHSFKDLGKDKLIIQLSSVDSSRCDNLKRMIVWDANKKIKAHYMIYENKKLVKNVATNKVGAIPDKFTFLNENEMRDSDYANSFAEYLTLYLHKMQAYDAALNRFMEPPKEIVPGSLPKNTEKTLNNIKSLFRECVLKFRKMTPDKSALLKHNFSGLESFSSLQGVAFSDIENNKSVHFLPINSTKHDGLVRVTITDKKNNYNTKMYLIKDNKHIVENFNPKYPQILPNKLTYVGENDFEAAELIKYIDYLHSKIERLAEYTERYKELGVAKIIKTTTPKINRVVKPKPKPQPKPQRISTTVEFKNLVNECKKEFDTAIKSIDGGIVDFQKSLNDIMRKITEYYYNHTNKGV